MDLKPLTDEDRAAIAACGRSHKNQAAVIRRIAELQIEHFNLTDTVDEYIEKTIQHTKQKFN